MRKLRVQCLQIARHTRCHQVIMLMWVQCLGRRQEDCVDLLHAHSMVNRDRMPNTSTLRQFHKSVMCSTVLSHQRLQLNPQEHLAVLAWWYRLHIQHQNLSSSPPDSVALQAVCFRCWAQGQTLEVVRQQLVIDQVAVCFQKTSLMLSGQHCLVAVTGRQWHQATDTARHLLIKPLYFVCHFLNPNVPAAQRQQPQDNQCILLHRQLLGLIFLDFWYCKFCFVLFTAAWCAVKLVFEMLVVT